MATGRCLSGLWREVHCPSRRSIFTVLVSLWGKFAFLKKKTVGVVLSYIECGLDVGSKSTENSKDFADRTKFPSPLPSNDMVSALRSQRHLSS